MTVISRFSAFIAVIALSSCSTTLVGESCSYTGECGGGLVCVNMTCSVGSAGYAPTGKVCIAAECRANTDCGGTLTCSAGKCVCATDADCGGLGMRCSAGQCVRCVADADCGTDRVCSSGNCRDRCIDNFDCPDFYACNGGKCSFVGCTRDKECAVAVRDARARCDTALKTCYVPCAGDVECNQLVGGQWFGMVCSKGRCENVGCDNDADCQVFLPTGTAGTCVTPPAMPNP
jgi:hypothetical protein